jgi:hypothetical protein
MLKKATGSAPGLAALGGRFHHDRCLANAAREDGASANPEQNTLALGICRVLHGIPGDVMPNAGPFYAARRFSGEAMRSH